MDTVTARTWRIYRITCSVNGKRYIGLTRDTVRQRWSNHVCKAMSVHETPRIPLHRAVRKYGRSCFVVDTICEVSTLAEAGEAERRLIEQEHTLVPSGYNVAAGGMGTPGVRRPHTAETKAKIADGNRGRVASLETRERQSASRRGKRPTPETLAKQAASRTGRKHSAAWRTAIADGHRGRHFPARSIALLKSSLMSSTGTASGSRGITAEGRRWTARIGINGVRVHLGVFDTIEEASAAYRAAVRRRIDELSAHCASPA